MNADTNTIALVQQLAAAKGYHLTGAEIAALCSLPHVIALHVWAGLKYYAHIGGWDGIVRFLKTGSNQKPPTT